MDCISLESITLPEGLECIDLDTFNGCTSLKEINIPENVPVSSISKDTPCFENKKKENPGSLIIINNCVIDGKDCEGDVVIPDGVTIIGYSAFLSNKKIKSVTIPSSVTEIYDEAFMGCARLETVTFNGSPEYKYGTFEGCTRLKDVPAISYN